MPTSPTPADRPADQLRATVARSPYCHTIRYGITGAPILTEDDMDGTFAPGVGVAPTVIEIAYSAPRDSRGPSVTASVTGRWTRFGKPEPGQDVTTRFASDPSGWPAWLAEEARTHALAVARQLLGTTTAAAPCPGFEKEYQGVSDAKRRLANCKHCGRSRAAHTAPPAPADRAAEVEDLRAELDKLIRWHKEDGAQAVKAATTITRLRAERAELSRQLDCLRGDMRDMETCLREQDAEFERIRRLADDAAAGVQPPTTSEAHHPGRCPVMIPGIGRCEQNADHPAPHTPEPAAPAAPEEPTR